jgi:hypothetical protein
MARKVDVEIDGDPRGLKRAFAESSQDAQEFSRDVGRANERIRRDNQETATSFQNLRSQGRETLSGRGFRQAAGGALAVVGGAYALTTALDAAGVAAGKFTGENSELTHGLNDAAKGFHSLLTLDAKGFFDATQGATQRSQKALADYDKGLTDANQSTAALKIATAAEAAGFDEAAGSIRRHVALLNSAQAATDALAFSQRGFNQTVIDGTTYLVEFKGAHDAAMNPTGQPQLYGADAGKTGRKTLVPLSPSQRRELDLIGQEGVERIPELSDRLRQLNGQMEHFNGNQEQRLAILTRIRETEKEIAGIYKTQADARKAAREAAERQAEQDRKEAQARAKKARELAAEREQARQFRLIGLSATGGEIIPGEGNLRKQLDALAGRDDIPSKLRNRFAGIRKALAEPGGLTDKTREAIRDFFRMVRQEVDKGDEDIAPYATKGLNTNQVLRGLSLSVAQRRALSNRLAGFNVHGRALNPGPGFGAYGAWFGKGGGTTVEVPVYIDGQKVGHAVKRYSQRDGIHSPKQKRGPNAGR